VHSNVAPLHSITSSARAAQLCCRCDNIHQHTLPHPPTYAPAIAELPAQRPGWPGGILGLILIIVIILPLLGQI
jgi:Protein of unknown function (DUF3309)